MNIGKVSPTDYKESAGIRLLSDSIEKEGLIKTFFRENDRTPNHDGYFLVSNINSKLPEKEFIVQIKTTSNPLKTKNSQYVYSIETKFFNYIITEVSENPAILFIIDIAKKIIYWKYISIEYLKKFKLSQDSITIKFNDEDILDTDTFYLKIYEIIINRRIFKNHNIKNHNKLNNLDSVFESLDSDKHNNIITLLRFFESSITDYCKTNKIIYNNINVDATRLIDIIVRVQKENDAFKLFHKTTLSNDSLTAYFCYWIIKLKPFSYIGKYLNFEWSYINEDFAIDLILSNFYNNGKDVQKLDKNMIKQLRYNLIYRDISQESWNLMINMISTLLD